MWHRFCKKVLSLCLVVMVSVALLPNILVYGASEGEKVTEVSDTTTVRTRGNFLNYGSVLMSRVSPTRVLITGITSAHVECDKLGVGLYLEQSPDGEDYGSYRQWFFWKQNASVFSQTLELIVPTGYWYRLKGFHIAIEGNEGESVETKTEGLHMP